MFFHLIDYLVLFSSIKGNIWIIGLEVLNKNLQHSIDNNLLHMSIVICECSKNSRDLYSIK